MPFSIDDFSLPPSARQRRNPVAPAAPVKAPAGLDAAEFQIKVLMPNDIEGQTLAINIFRAIKQAHRAWQSTATLIGVTVTSVTASGGTIVGPPLTPLIIAALPGKNASEQKLVKAVATVVGNTWFLFTSTVRVPGLPWYPAFAAVPSPVAPPMPNVPTPFAALTQVPGLISVGVMKPQVMAQLAPDKSAEKVVDAALRAFEQFILLWRTMTLVTNVLGTGPVPSFAPPFVPMGPVVGGVGNMTPGGFA
ncbi:MAG TPA: hypothetical protein VFB63_34510 [Bryobacteraceae bacterium]|nr:hypothetical protein [Bryobacteraceae bacterium]